MASKKQENATPKPKSNTPRFNDVTFVNWALSDQEKVDVKAWNFTHDDLNEALIALVEGGYKVTFSYDTFNTCYSCAFVPTKDAKSNQGYILSGKGSTPLKAFKQCAYIHYHIMGEEWAAYSTARRGEVIDD